MNATNLSCPTICFTSPVAPADPLNFLRDQLMLGRTLELEDVHGELTPALADVEKLLASAQAIADQKSEEAAHLAKTLSNLPRSTSTCVRGSISPTRRSTRPTAQ